MEGFTREGEFAGDYATPEQEIPAAGVPGALWETCMTMNDHWGYNRANQNWKSSADLIRKLADIASKGGNFLLNVGPTAEGLIPQPSVVRLRDIGLWMRTNGEAIHGTQAGLLPKLEWGRCTQRRIEGGTRLYLHVFDYPLDGKLKVPASAGEPLRAYLLADPQKTELDIRRLGDTLVLSLPKDAPDKINTVVVLEIKDAVPARPGR